jgi:hypothetical protein
METLRNSLDVMKRKIKNKACGKNQGRGYSQSRNKDWKD